MVRVRCVETGDEHDSLTDAVLWIGQERMQKASFTEEEPTGQQVTKFYSGPGEGPWKMGGFTFLPVQPLDD
eukprot:g28311.t1